MSLRRQSFQGSENSDGIPGSPGTDFPDLRSIPLTQFNCLDGGGPGSQPGGTRRPGFYADVETDCQVSTKFLDLNDLMGIIFNLRYFWSVFFLISHFLGRAIFFQFFSATL